ncbi:MAG: G5 domain-containing protein [Oscillospiraceae bacterium]|jgi:resuscitation-promoting factor RpfB
MRKIFEPVLQFFRRLAKKMRTAGKFGFIRRAGAFISGAKTRVCRFFMGLWQNWNTARKAGLIRLLISYMQRRKEIVLQSVRDRIAGRESALKSALLKQGAALVLMILVTVGSVKTVMASTHMATVICDGDAAQVEMTSSETESILLKAGVKAGPDDIISREDDPDHAGDVIITVKTARQVSVEADGKEKVVTAHYGDTVADVLVQAGISLDSDDLVTPDKDEEVTDETKIQVTRMYQIKVIADGSTIEATVKEGTVSDAVRQAGVQLGDEDILSVDPNEEIAQGMEIRVSRVTYQEVTETREIPYETITQTDSTLAAGTEKIKTAGKNGVEKVLVRQKLVDGEVTETQDISSEVITEPVDEIRLLGTKKSAVLTVASNGTLIDENGNEIQYKKVLTGKCSGYTGGGVTSTGQKAAFGLVAVNPNIIPYGTKLYIASPDGSVVYGYAVAADTGGAAMRGTIIADLYYDSYEQCIQFGTRTMNVYIL